MNNELQTIMQNKPNFRKPKMNLTSVKAMNYEQITMNNANKKQTQSNPISKAKKNAAARAYDAKAAELFGDYAALNFRRV